MKEELTDRLRNPWLLSVDDDESLVLGCLRDEGYSHKPEEFSSVEDIAEEFWFSFVVAVFVKFWALALNF
ncbi:hypothetical protein RIF29_29776 [Crotalaria pallida]|uniref:Uncharacterized protein n=1 Tax=Crotalaria pallida TaxID=3830 RepID=A0AAN9EF60_CROPI